MISDSLEKMEAKTPAAVEEWILQAVEADPLPVERLLLGVALLAEDSGERADDYADLVAESFARAGNRVGLIDLMLLLSSWKAGEPGFRDNCRETLAKAFSDRQDTEFLKASGLIGDLPVRECLRRLNTLYSLGPGRFCYDKTWGFGVVGRVDAFYQKVTIDFTRKPRHQMSFAYAAEVLDIVGDDHLLARKHRDPDGLNALVREDPAEVVRIALRTYGPMPASRLEERLVEEVLGDAPWKPFWDAARRSLKADPLVDVPTRRSEPIRLLSSEKQYDDAWFARLQDERDLAQIIRLAGEVEREIGPSGLSSSQRAVLGSRLAFAAKGARGTDAVMLARVLMAADRFTVPADLLDIPGEMESLRTPDAFLAAASGLPAKNLASLLGQMARYDLDRTIDLLSSVIVRLPCTALNEVAEFLANKGMGEKAAEPIRDALRSRSAPGELLLWACGRSDLRKAWDLVDPAGLTGQTIDALEGRRQDDRLRTLNQIRSLFEDREWLAGVLDDLGEVQRGTLFARVSTSRGWDEARRRSIMSRMIKLYPELLASTETAEEEDKAGMGRMTSWRSYRQRQEQLRKLVEVAIPENSKEIGIARSYGDLRENFEYQAAKDQQRILMQRQREWEIGLKRVRGTAFEGRPSDVAGMGTCVTVERPGGERERYSILGEWDSEVALGILPCNSRVAELLSGHKEGDTVMLPAEHGEEVCRIVAVEELPAEVKRWLAGDV